MLDWVYDDQGNKNRKQEDKRIFFSMFDRSDKLKKEAVPLRILVGNFKNNAQFQVKR
jgi:hypothetical protein